MLFIIKVALTLFVVGFAMIGLAGVTWFIQLTQRLNSTIRTILYTGLGIIVIVSFCMGISFKGVPILVLYGMGFIFLGFCSIPIRIFMRSY